MATLTIRSSTVNSNFLPDSYSNYVITSMTSDSYILYILGYHVDGTEGSIFYVNSEGVLLRRVTITAPPLTTIITSGIHFDGKNLIACLLYEFVNYIYIFKTNGTIITTKTVNSIIGSSPRVIIAGNGKQLYFARTTQLWVVNNKMDGIIRTYSNVLDDHAELPTTPTEVALVMANNKLFYVYRRFGDSYIGIFDFSTGTIRNATDLGTSLSGGIAYSGKSNIFYHYPNDYGITGVLNKIQLSVS